MLDAADDINNNKIGQLQHTAEKDTAKLDALEEQCLKLSADLQDKEKVRARLVDGHLTQKQ